ncbi:MAG TPA: signal peptide peptidase SppA [Bacteroidales bacterium]|nr:signal peptide peptidase SppA [Bacteroidales bacterium]
MKQFFKFLLASFTGTILSFLFLLFVFAGMLSALISSAEKQAVKVKENSVLYISFEAPIPDRTSKDPFQNIDFMTFKPSQSIGMNDILKNLDKAAADPNIAGIYMELSNVDAGMANLEEIREKLLQFKESGKFIVSYGETYSQSAYFLASVADEIYMNPDGGLMFKGMIAQLTFLKNMLGKLEVEPQIVRGPNNKYKSAVEPLILEKMSEANREQMEKILGTTWANYLEKISQSRNISITNLNQYADDLATASNEKSVELGFVDGLKYKDEVLALLREKTGKGAKDKIESVTLAKYTNATVEKPKSSKNKVAVVYAVGEISDGEGSETAIGSEDLSKLIRKLREDDKVKAIVMRVNSPGGSALASEVIRREVELARKEKPFIVSMGNVAASGGYWISTNSDFIFADPATITGSIGVFGVIPNLQKLFNNKLGITFDKVMTNKNADLMDVMEPIKPYHMEVINREITRIYDDFITLVADTRGLRKTYVDSIAQGRVWTGQDALGIGLVDSIGGLQHAIAYAAQKANLGDDYRVVEQPEQIDPIRKLIQDMGGVNSGKRALKAQLGDYYQYVEYIEQMSRMKGVQARLPFMMTIN